MTNQEKTKKFVENNVFFCLTPWVEELIKSESSRYMEDLIELSYRCLSFLDTLCNYGWEIRETILFNIVIIVNPSKGLIWNNLKEEIEDITQVQANEDHHHLYNDPDDLESIAETIANQEGIDQDEIEVLEFWAVSSYLAGQLLKEGHTVVKILGTFVWGRTTSGQAIAMDGVIERIANR